MNDKKAPNRQIPEVDCSHHHGLPQNQRGSTGPQGWSNPYACMNLNKRLAFMVLHAFPYVHVPLRIMYACRCLLYPVQTAEPVGLILCHYSNVCDTTLSLFTWYRTSDL